MSSEYRLVIPEKYHGVVGDLLKENGELMYVPYGHTFGDRKETALMSFAPDSIYSDCKGGKFEEIPKEFLHEIRELNFEEWYVKEDPDESRSCQSIAKTAWGESLRQDKIRRGEL